MSISMSNARANLERVANGVPFPWTGLRGAAFFRRTSAVPLKVLMVCNLFTMPYRVMRCAHAAGARISVLGGKDARGIKYSRYCDDFLLSEYGFNGEARSETAAEINRYVKALRIDLVLAGDALSTRTLIANQDDIHARCFPMPNLHWFDKLNNKWTFTGICQQLGIRCPPTRLLPDREAVLAEISSGRSRLPLVAKPLSLEGGHGVFVLNGANAGRRAQAIDYAPVLLQDFIPGEDVGASVYCEVGARPQFHRPQARTQDLFHIPFRRDPRRYNTHHGACRLVGRLQLRYAANEARRYLFPRVQSPIFLQD